MRGGGILGLALVLTLNLFSFNFTSPALAATSSSSSTDITLTVNEVLTLSVSNCDPATDPNNDKLTIDITPSPTGTFKSNCQHVFIDTNAPGYSLSIKASSTNPNVPGSGANTSLGAPTNALIYQNPTTLTPHPIIPATNTGTIASPTTLPANTWGFAVPNLPGSGFQTSYSTSDTITNNKLYAQVPLTDTQIYNTNTLPIGGNTFDFFYAANITSTKPAGIYTTEVTYTVIGKPVPPAPLRWKEIVAGHYHVCALAVNDKVYCWGDNQYGQLGDGTNTNRPFPTPVDTSIQSGLNGKTVLTIAKAAASHHTCVIASDYNAYCWGRNSSGQLGDGTTNNSSFPITVDTSISSGLNGKTVKVIATAFAHTCAIASDNNAYCWGWNGAGELGDGTSTQRPFPTAVNTDPTSGLNGKTVLAISPGSVTSYHTCAIASDNNAYCWGGNGNGQLGIGTVGGLSLLPVAVNTGSSSGLNGKTVKAISSAGAPRTCVIASDNNVYCWGSNGNGEFGDGTTTQSPYPTAVDTSASSGLNGKTVLAVTSGAGHTCATASDNNAYCWGSNNAGRLGDGTTTNRLFPIAVNVGSSSGLNGKTVLAITAGYTFTCTIANDRSAYCWGSNNYGQIGDGTSGTNRLVPTAVAPTFP